MRIGIAASADAMTGAGVAAGAGAAAGATATAGAAGSLVVLVADSQPANKRMAKAALKLTDDHCIRRFEFCIN
jgi:hypothetical protein